MKKKSEAEERLERQMKRQIDLKRSKKVAKAATVNLQKITLWFFTLPYAGANSLFSIYYHEFCAARIRFGSSSITEPLYVYRAYRYNMDAFLVFF